MIKVDINEIDFLLASMDKIQIPASASPQIADLLSKLLKEKEALIKKESKKALEQNK
tara:strand:- start:426 stop:596 length:171 start_codon:yes stop_codon:yes gene_type:complete